eukprot:TRINITY_DN6187_c0_g1_i3.p1 TRINITY_DN6187_c0_g1~~TRINITY_DN6187_c0_g1_i3.p1  ORF type:complete len:113 (-),score=45.05 TRINITY_DN6187_c0_g1_i3:177-515(-)
MSDKVGELLSILHNTAGMIHGDLTTSNIIIQEGTGKLVLIDFGLGSVSSLAEDKAVDLYVLERAFISTHPNTEHLFQRILDSYKNTSKKAGEVVLKKLDEVQQRGRKKLAFG